MTMKQLTWRLILPLTIISFGAFTKWWYVLPVDAPDTMMSGFPLAFVSDGWHTSLSLQIFLLELVFDFVIYFLLWFFLILLVARFWTQIKVPKILISIIWTLSIIISAFAIWIASRPEQIIQLKRDWDMQVLVTGYKLTWQNESRPGFAKYEPNKK